LASQAIEIDGFSATAWIRSTDPTDVPPNLYT
jgi:hypothetical protein